MPFHGEALAVGVGFEHQQRCVRRDDVELFAQRDDLIPDQGRRTLLEEFVEVHPRPKPRQEGVPLLGVLQREFGNVPHRLSAERPGDDDLTHLVLTFGQVAAEQNLLRTGRDVGQFLGVNAGRADAGEFDFQVAQRRRRDLGEQFRDDGLRSLFTRYAPQRTTAEGRDRFHRSRFETTAQRDGVEGPRLPLVELGQALGERHRVGIAARRNTISEIDRVRADLTFRDGCGEGFVEVRPTERNPLGQRLADGGEVLRCRRNGLLEHPIAIHIARRDVDGVLRREGPEQGGEDRILRGPLHAVHRRGRIGEK